MNTIKTLILFCLMAGFAVAQDTPATPLLLDISAGAKRSFNLPSGKVMEFKAGSTLEIDDGTVFNIGSTAATALRTAIGDTDGMKVFTNAANRAATTPEFLGQIGYQRDTQAMWVGSALTAGAWNSEFVMDYLVATEIITAYSATQRSLQVNGGAGAALFGRQAADATPVVEIENMDASGESLRINTRAGIDAVTIYDDAPGLRASWESDGRILGDQNATFATPAFSFIGDENTGIFRAGADQVGIAAGGANVGTFSASGLALAGPVAASAGTAGAPSLSFGTDQDSGVYSAAANSVGVAAGGANVGTFSASGLALTTALSVANGGTSATTAAAARTALGFDRALFVDSKAAASSGDAITAAAWTKVTLNTEAADTAGAFSVSGSVLTVGAAGAGTWFVDALVPFYGTSTSVTRLRRTNNTATSLLVGAKVYSWNSNYVTNASRLCGMVTLTAGDTLEVQAFTQTNGNIGFSSDAASAEVSIYSQINFSR